MKDFDALLRETLGDERWALPVPHDAITGIEYGARRVRRRRRTTLVAGVVAAVVAIGVTVGLVQPRGTTRPVPIATPSMLDIPPLGSAPFSPVLVGDSLYVATGDGGVVRLDARSQRIVNRSPAGLTRKGALLVAGGAIWLQDFLGRGADDPHTYLYRLDPRTLNLTGTITLPGNAETWVASAHALWATSPGSGTGGELVRRDGITGAVTGHWPLRRNLPQSGTPAVLSADEQAGVVWLVQVDAKARGVDVIAMRMGGNSMIGWEALATMPNGLVPGSQGSVWAGPNRRGDVVVHLAPQADGRGLRRLPVEAFPSQLLHDDAVTAFHNAGTRMWLAVATNGDNWQGGYMLCLDGASGATLARYPMSPTPRLSDEDPLPWTGNAHEVFLLRGSRLLVLRGPDPCLT